MAITMVSGKAVNNPGKEGDWYLAVMTSTEDVAGKITGADVDGANDDDKFKAGSVIVGPNGNAIALEDEVFTTR